MLIWPDLEHCTTEHGPKRERARQTVKEIGRQHITMDRIRVG